MERHHAAILVADVVGYSRLMGADEAETLAALKGHREKLIDPKAAQYRGRTVKPMGDAQSLMTDRIPGAKEVPEFPAGERTR